MWTFLRTIVQLAVVLVGLALFAGGAALAYWGDTGPRHDVGAVVGPFMFLFGVAVALVGMMVLGLGGGWLVASIASLKEPVPPRK